MTVLATSRASLDIGGELCFPVPGLRVPSRGGDLDEVATSPAVDLFTSRVALVRPGYRLDDRDVHAVVELCIRLDGQPLAIESHKHQLGADLLATAHRDRRDRRKPLSPACRVEIDRYAAQVAALRGVALTTADAVAAAHSLAAER